MNNAEKIKQYRDEHPGKRITEQDLLKILGVDSLYNLDLRGADLRRAQLQSADLASVNLTGADLWDADLWDSDMTDADLTRANMAEADLTGAILWEANLQNANLAGADLREAGLRNANLSKTYLRHANLSGATGSVAQINNLYPYPATLQPTPDGWYARVGCWYGTLEELRDISTSEDDWPEATGDERERRRPLLQAMLDVFGVHVKNHPDLIDKLHEYWGDHS